MPRVRFMLAMMCLVVLGMARGSEAHHFKGLPHFSYFENYPQVPQEEFLAQAGQHEFSLVVYDFQGLKREDTQQPNDVRFYLVIFSLVENTVYNGPITMELLDGESVVFEKKFQKSEEESLYAMHRELSPEGDYRLRVRMPGIEVAGLIPFQLSSQKVHWGRWVITVLVLLVVVAAYGSRKARVAMDRKENAQAEKA